MDEELRALERGVETGGAEARLRLARALERAGRDDDALDALLPAIDDALVRRELARWPVSQDEGRGQPRYLDARPLRSKPRVLFAVEAPGPVSSLAATPFAVVVTGAGDPGVAVLDPRAGATRWTLPPCSAVVRGDVVVAKLAGESAVLHHDLWTGELLLEYELPGIELTAVAPSPPGTLRFGGWLFAFPDPRAPAEWCLGEEVHCGDADLVFVRERRDLVAFDTATGARGFRLEGAQRRLHFDRSGVVTYQGGSVIACDRAGRVLWSRPYDDELTAGLRALTPASVLALRRGGGTLCLDRATGATRSSLPPASDLVVSRDVVHSRAEDDEHRRFRRITARALNGTPLWEVDARALGLSEIDQLRPHDDRVYVLGPSVREADRPTIVGLAP